MTTYQLFMRFLKYNNIYHTFFGNINVKFKEIYDPKIFKVTKLSITQAFYWGSTKQGVIFWQEVDKQWRNLMVTLELKHINVEQLEKKGMMELLKRFKINWG